MVVAGVKTHLADRVGDIEVSIHSVVSGRKLRNNLGKKAGRVLVKINIEDKYAAELPMLYRESRKQSSSNRFRFRRGEDNSGTPHGKCSFYPFGSKKWRTFSCKIRNNPKVFSFNSNDNKDK